MTSLLDLNQDCLNKIFSYLNIYELIDIEGTCRAFKVTCEHIYKSKKFHSIRFKLRYLRIEYLVDILDRVGPSLRSLEFSGGYLMHGMRDIKETLVDGILTNCNQLRRLTVNYVQFDKELFDKLQTSFNNLTYLNLSHSAISETSGLHLNSKNIRNLKELRLAGNANMSGAFFKNAVMVEVLDISCCFELRYFEFLKFLQHCRKLISLNISSSPQLIPDDQNILEDLYRYQSCLEVLICDNNGIQIDEMLLRKFKNLKKSSFTGRKFGT